MCAFCRRKTRSNRSTRASNPPPTCHFERNEPTLLLFRFILMNRSVRAERNLSSIDPLRPLHTRAPVSSFVFLCALCAPASVNSVLVFLSFCPSFFFFDHLSRRPFPCIL